MAAIAVVLITLASFLHFFIFHMEAIAWTGPRARATFGMTAEQAHNTKEIAFNQGFYNLFLAIQAGLGAFAYAFGHRGTGVVLMFAGAGAMLAAAIVLFIFSPDKRTAAIKQGSLPALGIVFLAASLPA